MTEAKVPIRTAIDAGSIQVSFCRAITNTFSAGGSDAMRTAIAAHGSGRPWGLPQAKPMKINPKYDHARLRISTRGELHFLHS
jgi:hypothetical protein